MFDVTDSKFDVETKFCVVLLILMYFYKFSF